MTPDRPHAEAVAVRDGRIAAAGTHAEATAASIEISALGAHATVTVSDDGVGMPAKPTRQSGRTNLAERARIARGHFSVASHPDGGTTVEWSSPFES